MEPVRFVKLGISHVTDLVGNLRVYVYHIALMPYHCPSNNPSVVGLAPF